MRSSGSRLCSRSSTSAGGSASPKRTERGTRAEEHDAELHRRQGPVEVQVAGRVAGGRLVGGGHVLGPHEVRHPRQAHWAAMSSKMRWA